MRKMIMLLVASCVWVTPAMAVGPMPTETNGNVCGSSIGCGYMETFSGGYTFRGRTTPSERGQIVRLFYRRNGTDRWKKFGSSDSNKPFIVMKGRSQTKVRNGGYWRKGVDVNGFRGHPHRHWRFRARFIRQDGYAASEVRFPVRVGYGD